MTVLAISGGTPAFVGLSSDTKPALAAGDAGATFIETDSGALWMWDGAAWFIRHTTQPLRATKTVAFTGAAGLGAVGTVSIFMVTGEVLIRWLTAYCSEDLAEAAPTATISLGITGSVAAFAAATNAVNIDAGEFWVDTTPAIVKSVAVKDVVISADVIATVVAQNVTDGTLRFDLIWQPVSSDGLIVAA